MLHLVEAHDRGKYAGLLDQMHVLRARVFSDRLKWDVNVVDGREVDDFDFEDPLYMLCVNESTQRLEGCVRLLPTTGPNMLRDVFSVLLPKDQVVESPIIWESSRFCIDPTLSRTGDGQINYVTTKLLCGLVEAGLQAGLSHIVSVYDARMARIFRAANCPPEVIGAPTRIGRILTYAGLFEISPTTWDRIAATGGVSTSVLSSAAELTATAA